MLALSSLSFDLSVYDIFGTLAAGATLVISDADKAKDPAHWAKLMQQHPVTIWNSVPALMQLLIEHLKSEFPTPNSPLLTPVAYLWTRTVKCPNPGCGAAVPLVRQTWLCKKIKKYVALKVIPNHDTKRVEFEVVKSTTEKGLGFDPASGSSRGNST